MAWGQAKALSKTPFSKPSLVSPRKFRQNTSFGLILGCLQLMLGFFLAVHQGLQISGLSSTLPITIRSDIVTYMIFVG